MSPEEEKRLGWWALAAYLLACILAGLIGSICRADSTFVPIEPPKPTVCQKVCPVCGNCVPVPRKSAGLITRFNGERISYYRCSNLNVLSDSLKSMKADFHITGCDSIIWGRYRTVCRIDSSLIQVPCPDKPQPIPGMPGIYGGCAALHWGYRTDTIYTDDPRCDTIPRARGLDSVYVLPHDSLVAGSGLVTSHTIQIPGHWEYFNWLNGKRVNMRRVK